MSSDLQKLQRDYFQKLGSLTRCMKILSCYGQPTTEKGDWASFEMMCRDAAFKTIYAINRLKENYKKERQRILDERAASKDKLSTTGCHTGRFLP